MFDDNRDSSSNSSYSSLSPHHEPHQDFTPFQTSELVATTSPSQHLQDQLPLQSDSEVGIDSQLLSEQDTIVQQKAITAKKVEDGDPAAVFPPLTASGAAAPLMVRTSKDGRILLEPDNVLKSFTGAEIDAYVLECRSLQKKYRHKRKSAHAPPMLTKEEERHLKALQKKVHNREYAYMHRRRKKQQAEETRAALDLANSKIRSLLEAEQKYREQIIKLEQEVILLRQEHSINADPEQRQPQDFVCPPRKKAAFDVLDREDVSFPDKYVNMIGANITKAGSTEDRDNEDYQNEKDVAPLGHQDSSLTSSNPP